jgi:DNA-binding PadR family transcriptional regulator
MGRSPNSSPQTEALLGALLGSTGWRYGYDLSRETGLKSGTLYPILMRLEAQGWLETSWADADDPSRPRRHLYRLSSFGAHEARKLIESRERVQPVQLRPAPEAR